MPILITVLDGPDRPSNRWLTAQEIGVLTNHHTTPLLITRRWLRQRLIFNVPKDSLRLFPAYALDPHAGFAPYPEMAGILQELNGLNGQQMAEWFDTPHGLLSDRRPGVAIACDPGQVVDAARQSAGELLSRCHPC